jgi:eukaryotic-like serine/threonine-protein kinase
VSILGDIAGALADLDGKVVHRDLKPDNVLLLNGAWCLADFGISRYAEATTAADTKKFALSPPYAAPERWRSERSTGATDIYSLGVIGYEMLSGTRPFPGPAIEDYRDQHLHHDPPRLDGIPPLLDALLEECLYKASGARPTAANFLKRLSRIGEESGAAGLARLREANRAEVARQSTSSRRESESRSVGETRRELAESAEKALTRIFDSLRGAILDAAPSATLESSREGWLLRLNQASLRFSGPVRSAADPWGHRHPAFEVVCHATLNLRIPEDRYEYEGRSHSLWFGDVQSEGEYAWFETAFMVHALIPRRGKQNPFALEPGEQSADALGRRLGSFQVAWPFTRLEVGQVGAFVDRWAGWFADAAAGRLGQPTTMPEGAPDGTWRQG